MLSKVLVQKWEPSLNPPCLHYKAAAWRGQVPSTSMAYRLSEYRSSWIGWFFLPPLLSATPSKGAVLGAGFQLASSGLEALHIQQVFS